MLIRANTCEQMAHVEIMSVVSLLQRHYLQMFDELVDAASLPRE